MARNLKGSRTEEAFENEIWRGADPERVTRFMLARFEDITVGMTSQGERIDELANQVARLTAGIEHLAGQVAALQAVTEERQGEHQFTRTLRTNFLSYLLAGLGAMFGVVMMSAPALITSYRRSLFGDDARAVVALGGVSVGFFIASVVARRLSGKDDG